MFYLPGFASVPIVIAGMLGVWLIWRMIKRRKKAEETEKEERLSALKASLEEKKPRVGGNPKM